MAYYFSLVGVFVAALFFPLSLGFLTLAVGIIEDTNFSFEKVKQIIKKGW